MASVQESYLITSDDKSFSVAIKKDGYSCLEIKVSDAAGAT